jgi:hypothetical protein
MKVQLLSDLHLERHPDFTPEPAPGAEVLVLAGDIGSYQTRSRLEDPDFGLARFSPLAPGCTWKTVLYVPGNHEYDELEYDETHARLRETCARLSITWLERERLIVGGIRFIGTTLWTDFDALAHAPQVYRKGGPRVPEVSTLTWQLQQREKAFRAANYYLAQHTTLHRGAPMLAEDIRELGLACQAWLRAALAQPFDGTTVVVTHFAPSLRSHDPRYGLAPGTAGFCNALDELLAYAQVWMHGHLHCPHDYVADGQIGGRKWRCRVVANPMGYVSKGEQAGFVPQFTVDVG